MSISVVNYQDTHIAKKFTDSLKEIGFAVIADHPIDHHLIKQVYNEWNAFFHSDEKYNFAFDKKEHDGFASFELSETAKGATIKDLKEFYHYYPWGRCPDALKLKTQKLFDALNDLARQLLSWVEAHMPVELREALSMPLSEMIKDSPRSLFRLIHYPALTGSEPAGAIRAAAHEDIDLLTVLASATEPGLQVLSKEGHWLDVPTDPNWLVINTGDMLAECTQGYYRATTHRVINPQGSAAKKSRLSMPLFLHPREEVRLSDRHTAGTYRKERLEELGLLEASEED